VGRRIATGLQSPGIFDAVNCLAGLPCANCLHPANHDSHEFTRAQLTESMKGRRKMLDWRLEERLTPENAADVLHGNDGDQHEQYNHACQVHQPFALR
jgi:hypothetical protein